MMPEPRDGVVVDLSVAVGAEASAFGDIVMVDLVESYPNLTLKSVIMLKYLNSIGLSSTRILKVLLH